MKKKIAAAFMIAALTVVSVQTDYLSMPMIFSADESEESEIFIEYNGMSFFSREGRENEVMLSQYYGTTQNIVVPETVEGYTVTGIGNGVFSNNEMYGMVVKKVTLPDTIDYFGSAVFQHSTVVSINIPKKLKFIPSDTFFRCKNLTEVKFHDDIIAIANTAFKGTDIALPQNLQQRVADGSRGNDNSKSRYYMANDDFKFVVGTNENDDSLFCNIEDYTGKNSEIVIPSDIYGVPIKFVGFKDFDPSSVTAVTFPETTENIIIDSDTFSGSQVTELNINSSCTFNKMSFGNCTNLKTIRFNDDAIINSSAFMGCTNLETVIFNGDATLDRDSFKGCTNLTSVEFGGKADLKNYAFVDCRSLENIIVDTSQPITGNAFNGCTTLMNINSEPAFDKKTGEFNSKYGDFIKNSFYMSEEIGFVNEYIKAQYEKIADEATTPEMSDIEKVKALHDWVCANTTYATKNTNSPEFHTDGSILLNDSTVCEGYAKALNLLCNYAGIETYYIHSNDHAWNIVKIDGHYFHVDSTWDDNGDVESYEWFMKSDSEINDGGSHSNWKAYSPTSLHSFQKEGTPECKYQIGDVNTDLEISIADLVKMNKILLNAETETADNIVLYDLNFDGNADVYDMILMRQKLIGDIYINKEN